MTLQETHEKTERVLEGLLEEVIKAINDNQIPFLNESRVWSQKREVVEDYVTKQEGGILTNGVMDPDHYPGFFRSWFFYELQQRTKIDFGFCQYFRPAYNERAQLIPEGLNPGRVWNKCVVQYAPFKTSCNGTTDRNNCSEIAERIRQESI